MAKPDPQLVQADAALRGGEYARAHQMFVAVTKRRPRDPGAHAGAGIAAASLGAADQSVAHLRRAVELDGRRALYHRMLGIQLRATGDLAGAVASLEKAGWLDRADTVTPTELAATLEQMGEVGRALSTVEGVLERDPGNHRATVMRARIALRAGPVPDETLEAWTRDITMLAKGSLDELLSGEAWDLLGTIRENRGDYDGAFEAFAKQNAVEGKRTGWTGRSADRAQFLERLARQTLGLTPEVAARWKGGAPDDGLPSPALLVGFPRSGTTLAERALSAHPEVRSIEERSTFEMVKVEFGKAIGVEAIKRPLVELLEEMDTDTIARLRAKYWEIVRKMLGDDPGGGAVVLDKMPLRITELPFVNRLFPESRVILALRDPRDVCLSCFRQRFVLNMTMSFFLTIEDTAALYGDVMRGWLDARDAYSFPMHELRYRDTVTDFESTLRRALGFLGLGWHDDVARFHETTGRAPSTTPSYHAVREEVHTGALGRWKNYETHLAPVLPALAPFVESFGYKA